MIILKYLKKITPRRGQDSEYQKNRKNKISISFKECPHCFWAKSKKNLKWISKDEKILVIPLPYLYSINLLPLNHSDDDINLYDVIIKSFDFIKNYLIPRGINKAQLITNRSLKPFFKNKKEHHHVQICLEDNSIKFD